MNKKHRVFIGSLATETNSFSPLRADLQDFKASFYAAPGEHPSTPTLCSAVFTEARECAAEYDWEIIEGTATWAEPSGTVNQQTWEFLREQLLQELRDASPVDIVLLGLHGAMIAQECLDCEGELLQMVRQLVGKDTIIAATLDPHSHLTELRYTNADLLVAFKEFPHTDFCESAKKLCQLAQRTALNQLKPSISVFDCKMIAVMPTNRNPMRQFINHIKALEEKNNIESISVIHGFMAGDVPEMGSKIMVITNNDQPAGDALAHQLGMELFSLRESTCPEFLNIETAMAKAQQIETQEIKKTEKATEKVTKKVTEKITTSPIVLADVWDNPGGGVPGDSTLLLQAIKATRLTNIAFATIWDPIAVRTCFSAGVGAQLKLRFGGKMSDQAGDPVDWQVEVKQLVPKATQSFGKSIVPLGDSVWIHSHGIDIILNSVRSQVFHPNVFSHLGIDPTKRRFLAIKSTNHFHNAFAPLAKDIWYLSIDGPYPNDPAKNHYKNLTRNIWPRTPNPHQLSAPNHNTQ